MGVSFIAFIETENSVVSKYHFVCFLCVAIIVIPLIKVFSTAYKTQSELLSRLDRFV